MTHAMLVRRVEPEALDTLPPDDPLALGARRDLGRVHRAMRTATILSAAIQRAHAPGRLPQRWLELGAGDATLLARLAPRLARQWPDVEVTLVDRQSRVSPWSLARLTGQGWRVRQKMADVFDVLQSDPGHYDLIFTTLFLHHFDAAALGRLLHLVAARTDVFVACEPRRSRAALLGSRLVGVLGANRVTRQDAVLSVRAGFTGAELSALWPRDGWQVSETLALPFTHCFVARTRRGTHDAV